MTRLEELRAKWVGVALDPQPFTCSCGCGGPLSAPQLPLTSRAIFTPHAGYDEDRMHYVPTD